MSTKKNIIKKSGTIALATVLVGSSLLSTLPVNVFASEAALKSAILTAAPANATEVATFAELKAALLNTSVTDIKLTADIKVTTSFNFTSQKNLYGNGHSIDMSFNRIGIAKTDSVNRVEDLTITNQNIYPLFWSEYKGVKVTYKDVKSSGQQFVYNANGTTVLEGNITASATSEEVYQGTTFIIKDGANVDFSSTSSCPAIRLYGSMTQEANSDLKVKAKDMAVYGHNSNTQITVAGNMDLTSTTEQAIYTAGSGGNMVVQSGAKFKATAGDLTEEGISITSGNLTVQSGADFVATSPGKQGTVQTGGKLVFENGSNFAITNTNAIGSVFANYAGSSTSININSDKGLSTWDSGLINNELPTHNYNDFTTATFALSGWDKSNISQKSLTSNSAQYQSQFVSKTTAKLFGGSYAMTNIAQTTIDELTTDSTHAVGIAEPNATIVIKDAAGTTLGTGKVGSDGYYDVTIPKQAANTKVTATATSNGMTSSATTTVKQATIEQTTIAALTTDSTKATGAAEPNADIEIKANGEVIGSGKVGLDGNYSITIPQQDVGTRVTATAKLGDVTSSATAIVTQGDLAQTTISALTTKSTLAEGVAQPNATIEIKNSAGDVLGSGKVGSDGKYSITIPKQAAGTVVTATATSNGKTSTAQTTVIRGEIDTTTINKVTTESTTASGTAEPNATLVIKDQDGEQLATGRVGSDGVYSLTIAKQAEGTIITATASLGDLTSTASTIVARDGIDQTTINTLTTESTSVSGIAEPNATVVVKDQDGKQLATGRVGSDGIYSMTIAKQAEGTVVTATATANGKTSSANTTVVRDGINPTTISALTADSTTATGTAEPNASIVIKNAAGTTIGSGTVGSDGKYSITIPKQAEGTVVTATATKSGKTESATTTVTAGQSIAKTTINSLTTDSTSVSGTAEPNSTVVVKDQKGTQIATGRTGSDGIYSMTIAKQAEGTVVTATATADGKTSSANTTVVRDGIAATTIDTLTADATTATGTAEPNATIVIKNAAGTTIGSGKVGSDGKYSLTIPKQAEGTVVTATATLGGKTSDGSTTVKAGQDIAKTTINALTTDSVSVSGKAEPNATLVVKVGSTTIATGTVGSDGNYSLTIPKQAANAIATATATKDGKTSSASTTVTEGKDIAQTTINALTNDSTTVSGKGEPNATIVVKNGATTIATGTVGSDGSYSLTIPKQAADSVVTATTTKDGKTSSASTTVTKQATGSVVVTAPYYVGYDSSVKATVSGDATKVYLQVGDTKYTTVPVSGSFTYYAKDKITATTQDAYIVALDASGKELSRAKVTLKDGKLLVGTVTPKEFIVSADSYVTGTYTGSVTKVAISVNGKVYPAVAVTGSGALQYYAKDKITDKTDVVKMIGYNSEGTIIDTKDVSVAGPESL
ncbi:Ig-like domain-containing protein, partial [Listeria rustica]